MRTAKPLDAGEADPVTLLVSATIPWRLTVIAAALFLLALFALSRAPVRQASTSSLASSALASHPALFDLPAPAQSAISETLGAARPVYRVSREGRGFAALSPPQSLSAAFARTGVSLRPGALHLTLSLRAMAEGGSILPVGAVSPTADANRVAYLHAGVTESYVNGPLGIEQVFTVPAPLPGGHSGGPLTLSIAISGNARASAAPNGSSILFTGPGGPSLRYTGLHATDASGTPLASSLALHGSALQLRIDTRGAHYPLRIDPLIVQASKFASGQSQAGGLFGISVALSADGSTALIGAPGEGGFAGAVWVFARSGSTWTQQGEALLGGGEGAVQPGEECEEEQEGESEGCAFGRWVALSADGNTAVIGAPREDSHRGAAWVFTRSAGTWSQPAVKLTAGPEESAKGHFGRSVAISADGQTVLVGAPADRAHRGSAWVFSRAGEAWTQQGAKLTGAGESGEGYLGRSVALSADGSTALVGAPGDSGHLGAAWVFSRSGETWTASAARLTGAEESGQARFGYSAAISADGDTALIGGRGDDSYAGAAWVLTRTGEAWSQQGRKLVGPDESGPGEFAYSTALSADGDTALLGAPRDNGHLGAAWVFTRAGETWTAPAEKLTGEGEAGRGRFGASSALSADASTGLIGAPQDNSQLGGAWTLLPGLAPPPAVTGVTPDHGPAAGTGTVTVSGHGFSGATAVSFGSTPAAGFTVDSGTSITAVAPAEPAGTVDVRVSTPAGSSAAGPGDLFTFRGPGRVGQVPAEEPFPGVPPGAGVLAYSSTGTSSPPACRVWVASRIVRVHAHARAALILTRTGTGRCAGRLTFSVRTRTSTGGRPARLSAHSIGAASFLIPPGGTQLVHIQLTPTGRRLLGAAHGRLSATLAILRLSPAPSQTRSAAVRLAPAPTARGLRH